MNSIQKAEAASHTTIATEYWKLWADFVFTRVNAWRAEGERSMRECMSNREEYDLDSVRRVVAHWAKIHEGGHEHRVAQEVLAERLAELEQPKPEIQLNAFRNLYRVKSAAGRVVAFVTAHGYTAAEERYALNGGAEQDITIEQISYGYPSDECSIYA